MNIEHEDDDDLPQFPWPMCIPIAHWIIHVTALIIACVYLLANGNIALESWIIQSCIILFILFILSVIGFIITNSLLLSLSVVSILFFAQMLLIVSGKVPSRYSLLVPLDALSLIVSLIVVFTFYTAWNRWICSRKPMRKQDSAR